MKKRIKYNHNNLFPMIAILLLLVSKSYAESRPSWGMPLVDTDYSACDIDAGDDKNICAGSSVILTTSVSSIVTYSWSPTTGLDDPSAANPVASPSSTTTYTVTVDDGAGCIGSDDVIVTVDDLPVISVATSISICQGQTTNETASATGASPFVYEWDGPSSGATLTATPTTTTLYTLIVTDALGCSSSALVTVNVNNLPTVTLVLDEAQVCQDASTVTLTGGSPLDGTYSGAFVTGSTFDVSAAGLGFHTITYSYTDANECEAIATQDLEVVEGPTVTFDLDIDNVCNDINTVIFEGGQPTGGSYSGSFVSGNSFDVSAAGQGTHTITYTYVNGAGCTDVATDDMIVYPLPVVSLTLSQQSFCTDDPIFALDGSTPSGGVYSGTGVTDNNFDPSLAGIGTHTLTYTYVDDEGCEGAATQDVIVYGSPTVSFSPSLTEICMNSPAYTLDGVSPVGGTFSGVGVEGSLLNPSAVVGQSTLVTYTYSNPNGCTASAVAEIFLTPMATISEVTVMDDLCDQGEGTLTVCYQDLSTTEQVQLSLDGGITWEAPISGCEIQLSSLPLTTVPGQGTALGTFIEGGTSISLDDNTWNVLEMNYNITANTVLTFEFASTVQGEEHSIGFSDQNTVASIDDNRFKLYGTAGPGGPYISGFDYTGGGSFQSFSIPIGDYLSGTVNYLALVNEDNTGSGNSIWRNIIIAESDEACITKQAASVTYTGLAAGNYDLQMRSPDGTCLIDLTDQTIGTIYNTVAADAGLDAEVCQGDPHTFTATGGVSYLWNDPAVTASANLTVSPSVTTTYVVTVTDSEGCTGTDEVLLTVSSTTVTFSETQDFFCTDDTTLTLTGGQPAGGVYSGTGVTSGVFDPMAAGVGAHILTYTYTDDCTYTVDFSVNVVQSPTATLSLIDDLACISEIGLTLEGGVPAGGQYSGVGVSNGNYLDVQLAGVGVHEITYTYTDPTNGCTATATQDFTITELPTVELILVQDEVCFNNTMMVLDGGSPAGGVYSGAGVDGTNFNPSETFPGLVTIGYTYQDANGCESIAYAGVTVHSGPTVSLDIEPSQVCINALATGLSGGQPAGGVYSGTGVEDGNFDPAVAGLGTHTITYTYIDTDGCEDSEVDQIEVINPQAVSLSLPDTEICEDVAGLNLSGGLPQGGSYSGPGVSGNYFDIAVAGAGTHTITYTLVDPNGCENSATQDITIYDLPEVELDFIQTTACYNDEPFALGGGTPAGGTYSGPGVVDNNFDPSMAFVGTVTIAYTYTDPTTGCTNNAISNIEVQDIPTVTLSLSTPFVCVTETSVTLQGGTPSDGTYSGPGVTDGVFDATAVGTGSYPITYTVTNANGCTETATEDIQVSDPAIATLNLVQSVICSNAASLVLSGGSPSGGSYSGTGVTNNSFDAMVAGVGLHTITYNVIDPSTGCEGFATQDIEVVAAPTVTMDIPEEHICIYNSTVTLTGALPSGGVWTGAGVTGNNFDATSAGAGIHIITYTYTDDNGCTVTTTDQLEVHERPEVTLNLLDDTACVYDTNHAIGEGIPAGGTYTGTGVSGSNFDPSQAGLGTHIITYTVVDVYGCENSASQEITVVEPPLVSINMTEVNFCFGEDNIVLNASPAGSGGTWSGSGISGNTFNTTSSGIGTFMLTYTFVDASGCEAFDTQEVVVTDLPTVTLELAQDEACITGGSFDLAGATPPDGWYTGPGVSGTTFDPSEAGLGDHTITYHYEDANGCVNTATDILTVFPEPVVTIDLEDDEVCINEIITLEEGQPAGGTWSGTGVAGNEFDASIAGAGTHTITYVYDLVNCSVSATTEIVVYALPVLVLDIQSSVACEGDILALDASPSGGDWSGPGIANGQMNTAISGPGTHTITYSYTDANGCEASEPVDILVHPETDVTLSLATTQICIHDDPITLTGGAPAGGTFTGPGVSGGVFDPAVASTGLHTITYNLTDTNGCIYTASQNIRVVDAPSVSLDLVSDDACQSDDPEVLRGGSPIGGTWDGPGVSGNMIDPVIAGVGVHTITYTVIGNNGCSATATDTYEVYPDGSVELALTDDSFCIGESGIILDGGTPSGGEYSGPGVNSNTGTLNTVIAGVGTHTIEYFFRDGNGCSGFATDEITIYDIPAVTYRAPIDLVCSTEAAFALMGGAPAGGTYSGPGVSGGIFDPMAAGAGYHTIIYTYVDANGCQSVDTDEILVEMAPVVTFVIDDDHCGLNVGAINFEFQDVSGVSLIQFSVNGGITWSQDVDDDTGSVSFNSLSSGDYDLLVRNSSGACELDLGTVTIQNISAPNANAGSDQSIVPPGSAQLSGSGGLSFSWSPSTGLDDPSSPNPIASPQETTTYTLVVTDEYGCTDSDDVVVTVVPPCGGIIGQGDYPYRESFESGFGLWTQEVISDDFDWIIENGFPGPSNASDGSMYAFAGCTGCAGAAGATAVVTSTSVIDPNNALGLPDGSFARVYNFNSTITLDLGTTLPTGTNIFITWRRKTSYAPGAFADMIVQQSSNATNWIEHSVRPSTSSQNFITTTLSLETPTRYIRVWEETGVNDDFDLDAIVTISGSSDLTGILKSPCFNLVDESCAQVTFDYNMNGQTSGWFSLEVSNDFGQSWTDLGTYVADGSSSWTTEIVDLFSYIDEVNVQLRFITELDGSVGYAIDNFEAITTGCGCDDTSSPFEAFNLVPDPQPFSIDIDCDGDADMLAGGDGELFFFENNGDNTYTDRTGTAQDIMPPLSFLDMTIGFVDLDGDGDKDLSVVGNEPFNKYFYWNTGSKTNPVFTEAGTGGTPANPISGFDLEALDGTIWVGYADATIFWADLDRDGDYDAVVGGKLGWFHYYENQGSETTPNLVRQFGANNPFNGLRADGADEGNGIVQYESAPFLTDWDGDGDLDMFSGNQIATVQYFENIGTATDPVFVEVIGDNNPFDGVIFSEDSHLSIVDEDCDNDWDVFYGVGDTPEDAEATVCDLLVAVPNIAIANSSQDHYCIGETVFLFEQSQSGVSWLWTGPNGFTSTEQNPIITDITEAGAGTYNVEVTNDQGCEFMSSIDITVSEASADAGPDFCIELGETTQLQGSGMGTDFLWIPSAGLTNPTILNPFSSPTNSTTYTLTVTDEFGCSATDDMVVIVKAPECIYGEEIFHADFETTTGDNFWSITNGANDGNFIIGVPNPYGTLGVQMELPAQQGDNTLLTGNGLSQDLDGFAATSASSRDIVLPSDAISLNISLYWYFSHFRNSSASDYFTLEIRDSGNNAVLFDLIDIVGAPTERPALWSFLSVDISSLVGETVYIYAEGRDAAGGSKLEIALDQIVITGNYSTVATLTLPEVDFCENLDPIELTGGEPAGGTYGGTGVSTDGFFDPQIAGAGTHTIFYEYSENVGCTAIASTAITVFEVPDVDIALAVGEACVNETAIGLFGGSPTGGTYSGPGVTGAAIDPSMAGVGVHTITYTITDDNGCENSITDEFEVFAIPLIISVDSQNALCDSDNGTITVEIDPTASPMGAEISIDGGSTWTTIDATANGIYMATDLLAGDYSVWIRNIDSTCPTEIENVTIVNEPGPAVSIGDDLQICGSGSSFNVVALTEFGTAPLTIDWQGPDGFMASGTDIDIENPGQYSVVVTDANNCIATDTMELIFFTITSFVDIQDETCFGFRDGSLSVFASGAQPINYNLVGEEINTTGQFDNLASGKYQIIVEDANGCTLTQEYTIAGPVELVCAPDSCVRNITQEWSGAGPYTADLGMTGVTLTTNSGSGASVGGVDFSQELTENSGAQIAGYVEGQFDFINSRNSFAGPAYLFDNIDNIGVATFHAYRDVPNEDWGIGYRLGGLFEIESLAIDLRNDCCTARGLGGRMQVLRNGVLVYESDELAGSGNGVISASPLPQVLGDEVRYIFLDGKNTNANGRFLNFTEWIIEISDSQSNSDWYTEMAINNPSISMDIAWDTTPEAAGTDIDLAGDDKANTDITFEFDEPVSHLVLHVDRLGELVNGVSNSSMWTLLTPNVTLQKVSGTSDLQVTSTTFYKSIDVATISAQGDASFQAVSGAAAGSISIVSSTPLTSLSFRVTGAGVEGNGYDVVELALSGTVCYPHMIQDFGCGEAQGSATISALGGTPPYTYLWDNMETTQTALSLDVGVHSVTITDAQDCEVVCSVEIEQDQLEVEAGNNISFCEGESGVLSPMITSDATPYGISWEGPSGFASDIESPTVSDAGIYTLTVTDANGCTATDVVEVFTFVCDNESECYYLHNFNTSLSYFGSEGALSWSDYGWDETGDNNTSNSGNIMIFNNALLMENTGSATTSIQRRIDLTGQSSAILSFDVLGEGALDAGDEFIIEVFDGTTWTTIYTHNGPISAHMPGFDISAYISAFTEIRITIVSGFEDSGERLFIDNVRIDVDCLCDGIADAGPDEVLCLGDEVQLTASGGVDYVWSPAADLSDPNVANPTASPSETTTYTVTVTDTNGCPDTDELTITVVTAPEVTVTATQDATCGEDNGFISICVTGLLPTEEVEVSLDNGLTWQVPITDCETYDGLAPGAYNVIVRKTTGECPVTLSEISILDTPVVMLDLGLEQEICPLDQATISANPSGGRPPLTYSWVGPNGYTADTEQITVSEEGLYSVTVTDADNCTDQDVVSINVLDVDGGNIELTELLCPENDPSFIISVSEPSICNLISNPEANQGLDNWVIQNNTAITPPATIAVDDTGVLSGDNSIYVDITNTTGVDEDIAIVLSGISLEAGETYTISFEASAQINRPIEVLLQNNNISLWSENINLATTGNAYTFTFTATEDVLDAQLVFNLGVSNASIWLDNVVVKQQSCEEPSYDYVWECRESDGAGGWTDWVVVPEANGETLDPEVLSNTKQYRRLAAAEGCITYSASNIVEIEICPCTLDAGGEEIICLGESVTLMPVASGFGTLSFLWSPSTSLSSPVAPTPIATPETTTTYSVTVTDEFGCETTGEVLVTVLVVPATTISHEDTSCDMDNGSITIDFEDLPDTDLIQFSLDGGTTWQDAVSDADGSVVYTDLANGFYDIWIRLADGSCPVDLDDVTIIEKPELMVELGEDQTLCVGETALFVSTLQNGTAPFTYLWDGPGGFTSDLTTISVTDEGMYTLVVSDADGCETTDTVTLHLLDIAPGMIATPQMTCPDNDPGLIMSTVDPTACDAPGCIEPTYVYVWECRESDGAGGWTAWTTIAGAVESSYDPPVQMATKQYRRLVSAAGCDDYYVSNEVEVEICPCDISVGDNQEICQGESVMLSAIATGVGEISYEWTPSESLDDPNSATPVATPEGTTTYTVTATDAIGCVISEDVTLTQLDSTVVWCERYRVRDEEGNWGEWMPMDDCTITLCEMNGLQDIEVDGGPDVNVGWVWTDEDGNPLSETDEMVTFDDIGLDDAGTYTGRLTNQDGCESVLHFDVIVNESVDASVTGVIHDYCLDSSGTATITITEGEGPFTISWQNEVGGESGTTTISEPGEYTIPGLNGGTTYCIGVEDINGCQLNP